MQITLICSGHVFFLSSLAIETNTNHPSLIDWRPIDVIRAPGKRELNFYYNFHIENTQGIIISMNAANGNEESVKLFYG